MHMRNTIKILTSILFAASLAIFPSCKEASRDKISESETSNFVEVDDPEKSSHINQQQVIVPLFDSLPALRNHLIENFAETFSALVIPVGLGLNTNNQTAVVIVGVFSRDKSHHHDIATNIIYNAVGSPNFINIYLDDQIAYSNQVSNGNRITRGEGVVFAHPPEPVFQVTNIEQWHVSFIEVKLNGGAAIAQHVVDVRMGSEIAVTRWDLVLPNAFDGKVFINALVPVYSNTAYDMMFK